MQRTAIRRREAFLGETGTYYPMLYTTLFMWGVEVLGREIFLEAAFMEADRFHEHFLKPCAAKSRQLVAQMAGASSNPFIFVHDDLASAQGPVFPPAWYEDHIFPHYADILAPAREADKKVVLVADGNMSAFLPRLVELGFDGIMFETPATPLEAVVEHFGGAEKFFIGGIDSRVLTRWTYVEVQTMVHDVARATADCPGFALASGGGLHGNIPLENLIAYFDARADVGATPKDWKRAASETGEPV